MPSISMNLLCSPTTTSQPSFRYRSLKSCIRAIFLVYQPLPISATIPVMRLLRLRPFASPKSYCFVDPDTQRKYLANSKPELIKSIVQYRAQNELTPLQNLDLVLDHYWAKLPENAGIAEVSPNLKRGFYSYIKGGIALIDTLFYGERHMVSQEEADRRAQICLACPHNQFPDKGPFVNWSDQIAEASVGDRRSKHHYELGNCMVCSCTLKAKVHFKGDMGLTKEQADKMLLVNCWQPSASTTAPTDPASPNEQIPLNLIPPIK